MIKIKGSRAPDGLPGRYKEYSIDRLKPGDLPQIARMESAFFPEPLSLCALFRLWLMPHTHYLVVRQQRQVAAWIGFQIFGPAAHTISMGVHPAHRRRGLAMLVQTTADRVAANRGARWFTGEVRVSNIPQLLFLRKLGWREIATCPRFFKNGEDAIVVWSLLPPPPAKERPA